jgi:hypothetical protein
VLLYYIEVYSISDIITTFVFSKEIGIRLSIKNSSYDYFDRNSLKRFLDFWIHIISRLIRNKNFVPENCYIMSPTDIITTTTGISSDKAYKFADTEKIIFIRRYVSTISITRN